MKQSKIVFRSEVLKKKMDRKTQELNDKLGLQ